MSRKKHHEEHHEEHIDEGWLIPYADLLTLLLALFIVLFASAQVDQKKFEALAQSFNNAFGSGSPSVLDSSKTSTTMMRDQPTPQSKVEQIKTGVEGGGDAKEQAYMRETVQLMEIKRALDNFIQENNAQADLQTVLTEEGLMIRIKDTALFPSGSAELVSGAQRFAAVIARMVGPLQQQIMVSGHTDNVPINTTEFPSNWDLSAKRSVNFTKLVLRQDSNLNPERFSAVGYAEYRPVMTNQTADGRSKNRRVEVLIARGVRL